MALDKNRVELAGVVSKIRGGYTRIGGYWLLMDVEVDEDGKINTFPVWWFGGKKDNDVYVGVAAGDAIEVIGQLKWGRDNEDRWELRIQALSFGVTERASRKQEHGSGRNGRNERRDRTERRERIGRSKPYPPEEYEPPF